MLNAKTSVTNLVAPLVQSALPLSLSVLASSTAHAKEDRKQTEWTCIYTSDWEQHEDNFIATRNTRAAAKRAAHFKCFAKIGWGCELLSCDESDKE